MQTEGQSPVMISSLAKYRLSPWQLNLLADDEVGLFQRDTTYNYSELSELSTEKVGEHMFEICLSLYQHSVQV